MLKDDKMAIVTPEEFDALPEYRTNLQTNTAIGRFCKRNLRIIDKMTPLAIKITEDGHALVDVRVEQQRHIWQLGECVEFVDPSGGGIVWRDLLVVR